MTRFLPRLLVPLVGLLAAGANAQSPSPAQMGITHSTVPEVLQVLDHTQTWVTIGNVDPTTHQFMLPIVNGGTGTSSPNLTAGPGVSISGTWPNQTIGASGGGGGGGGTPAGNVGDFQTNAGLGSFGNVPPPIPSSMGGEADIVVTDPTVGMAAVTASSVTDNSPLLANLMAKMGPPNPNVSGYDVTWPSQPRQNFTEYYHSQPLDLTRGGNYHCSGTTFQSSTYLVFAAGIDGVIQDAKTMSADGGAGSGMLSGCTILTMGFGVAIANPITPNVLTGVYFYGDPAGLIPPSTWQVGDGIILAARVGAYFPTQAIPAAPIGTTVTGVSGAVGSQNLTLSDPVSSFLGASTLQHSTAVFTETGSNNFANNETITVGSTTYKAVTALGTTPNNFLIGVDFPTSAANLIAGIKGTAGQFVTYVPPNSGPGGFGPNLEVTAAYAAGAITFTSIYSGPAANTLVSTASSAAGTFGGATFTGANDATTCPAPCTVQNVDARFFQLPASQAFQVQTTLGSNSITLISGPRLLHGGDIVWSRAFPFGSTVFSTSGTTFPETATMTIPSDTGGAQNALLTYAPGAEGPLWILPEANKRRTAAAAEHNVFSMWPIGMGMACSSGNGLNCDLSRDDDNYHQLDLFGRWDAGNNTSTASSWDEQFSGNMIADIAELSTLGVGYYNPNPESPESGTAKWGFIMNCANQNATTIFGGYFGGGGNSCSNQTSVYPPTPGGPMMIGPFKGYSNGPTISSNTFRGIASWQFLSNNDATQCVQIGGPPGSWFMFGFGLSGCVTGTTWGIGYNATNKDWELGLGGLTVVPLRYLYAGYNGYAGSGVGLGFPSGVILAGDGNNSTTVNARLFGMTNFKPTANWHLQGDAEINTVQSPGGQAAWYYAPQFSTTLTAAVAKGQPTSTPISVAACPTVAPPAGTLVSDQSASLPNSLNVNLCVFSSCAANQITCTAATLNASAAANDPIKLLYPYGAAPISNDPANPDYTATTLRSGSAANKDVGGRITLAAGTATYTLTGVYATAPVCFTADATTPANASSVSETTTVLTFTGTGTDVIKYHCIGRN